MTPEEREMLLEMPAARELLEELRERAAGLMEAAANEIERLRQLVDHQDMQLVERDAVWAAEVERLRGVIAKALAAGGCAPAEGSDAGWCLIDHVALGRRDLIELREEVGRLHEELAAARGRCEGLAERVAAQSELLGRRAERPA